MSTFRQPPLFFNRYRVAAIQYEPVLGEKEKNVDDLLRLVEEAAQHDARLIVLPEMATTGYCWESRSEIAPYVEPIPGSTTDRFQRLATTYNCFIAIGLAEIDPATDVYYNSVVLLGPEGLVGSYRKIHSYISEPRWARDGDLGMPVWDTPLGRLAPMICMDAMYFEAARTPALHGADVLLFPTNWLDEKCPSSWWMARAFENGVYLIAANRYGCEPVLLIGAPASTPHWSIIPTCGNRYATTVSMNEARSLRDNFPVLPLFKLSCTRFSSQTFSHTYAYSMAWSARCSTTTVRHAPMSWCYQN